MDLLGGSDSEDSGEVEFKINTKYAKGYKEWRSKEEKQKLIDKYGEVESSSSSEEEEIRSTKQMDKDWLRAYAVVHFQQARLYKEGEKFFHDEAKPVPKKKEKPTTLKDYERNFLLEKGGIESDDEPVQKPKGKSYFEEQEEIKKSIKEAAGDSSSDEDEDDLLVKRPKTKEEQIKEENEYLEWLKGERDDLEDTEAAKELAPLKAYWNDPNLSEKERVLRDYVLNNGYMDQEESDDSEDSQGPDHEEEEEFLEKAEEYEHRYNFRHEEPGGDEIKSYPRVIEESVRNKDTRRIEKRKRRMEKKQVEKEQRQEEIRLLQKLHKEERKDKMRKLREIASNPTLDYDLEADFNPEEHDKIMQTYFGNDYYGDEDADEKPTFEYDAAIDDEPDDWWSERLKEDQDEQGGVNGSDAVDSHAYTDGDDNGNFNMDADYDSSEEILNRKEKKKRLKTDKKQKRKLPLFDPTTKTFDEYIEEYLKDKIGTLPFTYREVVPNDFGLTTQEILTAQEKELNTWVSVKKMSQYRSKAEELTDKRKFTSRSRQPGKKMKVIPSLFKKPEEDADAKQKKKKKKKEKKNTDEDAASSKPELQGDAPDSSSCEPSISGLKKTSKLKETDASPQKKEKTQKKRKSQDDLTDDALLSSPPKKKKKIEGPRTPESFGKVNSKSKGKAIVGAENNQVKGSNKGSVSLGKEKKFPNTSPSSSDQGKMKMEKKKELKASEDKNFKIPNKKNLSEPVKKKKKKNKLRLAGFSETPQHTETQSPSKADLLSSKRKKKKLSISNFNKSSDSKGTEVKENKKKLQQKLSQMMSASRLSKFGIGPKAPKGSKKRRKKSGKTQ